MAYTETALSAADIALAALDKPIIAGWNPDATPSEARWRKGASPTWTTDQSDADFLANKMLDRRSHLPSKGEDAQTVWGAMFMFPAAAAYDILAIMGHNFSDFGVTTIRYQIADDTGFTTNLITVSSFAPPSDNKRLVDVKLGSGTNRYTGTHYGRLVITTPGTEIPEIGEVIFLRRRQLARRPNRPYDPAGPHLTTGQGFRSQSGVETFFVHTRGQRLVRANLNPDVAADQATLRAAYVDAGHGSEPIVWIEEPETAPEEFLFCNMSGSERDFSLPFIGPNETEVDIALNEQGPERFYFSQET